MENKVRRYLNEAGVCKHQGGDKYDLDFKNNTYSVKTSLEPISDNLAQQFKKIDFDGIITIDIVLERDIEEPSLKLEEGFVNQDNNYNLYNKLAVIRLAEYISEKYGLDNPIQKERHISGRQGRGTHVNSLMLSAKFISTEGLDDIVNAVQHYDLIRHSGEFTTKAKHVRKAFGNISKLVNKK
ncbi:hypothetical protein HN924_03625 [Candidatus Woesearchaeota archaeon]|jgi:hypothetical protein|nr:hypothetical protein [Candidatus Woesearchaeota archaeon]MBT7063030.1 hypothetical protein [Candidatus Woesearchaeota archaeon]MBT7402495.1 hypothetical protein [Candidatus Woesearchaeota archaeon]